MQSLNFTTKCIKDKLNNKESEKDKGYIYKITQIRE